MGSFNIISYLFFKYYHYIKGITFYQLDVLDDTKLEKVKLYSWYAVYWIDKWNIVYKIFLPKLVELSDFST